MAAKPPERMRQKCWPSRYTLPPGSKEIYTARREAPSLMGWDGMGWMGWDGMGWDGTEDQMGPSIFFLLCWYIDRCLYTCSIYPKSIKKIEGHFWYPVPSHPSHPSANSALRASLCKSLWTPEGECTGLVNTSAAFVRAASPPFPIKESYFFKFMKFSNFHQKSKKRPVAVCVFEKPYF